MRGPDLQSFETAQHSRIRATLRIRGERRPGGRRAGGGRVGSVAEDTRDLPPGGGGSRNEGEPCAGRVVEGG